MGHMTTVFFMPGNDGSAYSRLAVLPQLPENVSFWCTSSLRGWTQICNSLVLCANEMRISWSTCLVLIRHVVQIHQHLTVSLAKITPLFVWLIVFLFAACHNISSSPLG